jgi:hypothetical protein
MDQLLYSSHSRYKRFYSFSTKVGSVWNETPAFYYRCFVANMLRRLCMLSREYKKHRLTLLPTTRKLYYFSQESAIFISME